MGDQWRSNDREGFLDYHIREATSDDAQGISSVILATLRVTNAADYDAETLGRVAMSFTPAAVAQLLERRIMFVAVSDGIVATASLESDVLRSVFVNPANQRSGIGEQLVHRVECEALKRGFALLKVPSSVTAQGFYAKLGYRKVREVLHGLERTVVMEKSLADRARQPLSE
ncbi:GNAT family N-acetyltransferase [Pseudomonas sp. S36]|nr:GNAT family N-acetyltransferase [Pseudomonas sp. S36]